MATVRKRNQIKGILLLVGCVVAGVYWNVQLQALWHDKIQPMFKSK